MIGKRQIALKGWTIGKRQIALKGPMIGKWQKYIWDVGNPRVNVRWRHSIPEQCAIICSKPVRWLWNGNAAAVQPPWSWGSMIFKKPSSVLAVTSTIVMSLLALPIPRKWTLPQCASTGGWMVRIVRAGSHIRKPTKILKICWSCNADTVYLMHLIKWNYCPTVCLNKLYHWPSVYLICLTRQHTWSPVYLIHLIKHYTCIPECLLQLKYWCWMPDNSDRQHTWFSVSLKKLICCM